jgi:hypothetical protein
MHASTAGAFPVTTLAMNLRRRLGFTVFLLLALVVVSATGYRLLGGPKVTALDAIYMAVVTVSTVGYTEVIDTSSNPALRVFNIFEHYNPRDFQGDVASYRYGAFLNSVGRTLRGKFTLEF